MILRGVVIQETLRRHLTHVGFVVYAAFLAIIGAGVSQFGSPGVVWPSLVGLLAVITGCGPIGPEFSSGTLQLILVKPINRSAYLLSRVAGVVLAVWLAALVPFMTEVAVRLLKGDVPLRVLGVVLLNTMVLSILTVAFLTFLGSLTRSYLNVAIYVVVLFALNVAPMILGLARSERLAPVVRALGAVERNLYPEAGSALDWPWMLLVLSNAAVALVLACVAFRNREVPYGAD